MINQFFTADTHFFHDAILEKCRPSFASVDEMNRSLISNWNGLVGPQDLIYHLGDVSFGTARETQDVLSCLNGYKILIRGNHDRKAGAMLKAGFDAVVDSMVIKLGGQPYLLSHLPYRDGQLPRHIEKYGELYTEKTDMPLICGHVHQSWRRKNNMFNCGVDVNDYFPVSGWKIVEAFSTTNKKGELIR